MKYKLLITELLHTLSFRRLLGIGLVGLLLFSLVGCEYLTRPEGDKKVLAKVGDETLFLNDVVSIFTLGVPSEDSVKLLQNYVDSWVKRQLKIREAEKVLQDSPDIERMVRDYRNSLLTYKLDEYYIDTRLDALFTDAQVSAYYQQNKADFILSKPIVKARILRIPDNFRQKADVEKLMQSARREDYLDLVDIANKNNLELKEFDTWTDFAVLLQNLPIDRSKDYDYMLKSTKIEEFKNAGNIYMAKILEGRAAGDYTPEESVTEVIRRVIYNQRKQEVVRSYEDSLYRAVTNDRNVVINVN